MSAPIPPGAAILPGATIGVLGSGQLGRMFAIAARRMGYRVHTYSPDRDTPTGQIGDREYSSAYEDLDEVRRFARGVNVVTFEFENVPSATLTAVEELVPCRPKSRILHTTQNRLREKTFLSGAGIPIAPFAAVQDPTALEQAMDKLGYPAVLKTAGWGYDGKGQCRIDAPADLEKAWKGLNEAEAVVEGFVDFVEEASIIVARGLNGDVCCYPMLLNRHRNHILDVSVAPAGFSPKLERQAVELAQSIAVELDLVGVLCVEMFVTRDEQLLVNELAPRPHNSGHLTFDANVTSQFEQQLRAVCGLPLGSTELLCPAAMANLLGDLWGNGEPNWAAACGKPNVKLHLYGKSRALPGRKMGHMTALAADPRQALADVLDSRAALHSGKRPESRSDEAAAVSAAKH